MRLSAILLLTLVSSIAFAQNPCLDRFREIVVQAKADYKMATVKLDSLGQACEDKLFPQKADTLALIYHKKGVYHYLLKEYQSAIDAYAHSLSIRLKDPQVDPVLIGHSHLNLAKAYKKLRNYPEAKSHLQTAYDTLIHHSNYKRTGETCHELALVLWELRDFYPALDFAEQASTFYHKAEETVSIKKNKAAILLLHGVLFAEIGKLDYAELAYLETKKQYEELGLDFQVAKCWNNLGEIFYQKKEFERAIEAHKKGIAILRKIDFLQSAEASQMYNAMGVCWMNLEKWENARINFNKALSIAEKVYPGNSHPDIIRINENRGDFHFRQGYAMNPLTLYDKAINAMLPEAKLKGIFFAPQLSDSTFINGDYHMLLRLIHGKAKVLSRMLNEDQYKKPGRSKKNLTRFAMDHYKAADKLLFRMRREQLNVNSHLYWVDKGKSLYQSAIDFCFKTGKLNEALYFAERSKASILLEGIRTKKLALQSREYQEVLDHENLLKTEVFAAEQRLADAINSEDPPETIEQLKQALVEKRIELHQYVESLQDHFPQYFQAIFDGDYISEAIAPEKLGLSIQGSPKTVVQFFEGEKKSYVFVLQELQSWMDTISWNQQNLNRFLDLIQTASSAYSKEGLVEFQKLGSELYADLLGILDGKKIHQNLVIIPDGSLQRLPFEALLTHSEPKHSYQELPYLIKDYSCSYAYSISVLEQSWRFKEDKNWGILGIAPVNFPEGSGFSSLPQSRVEVSKIVGRLRGRSLFGKKATVKNFKKYLNQYKVLHFATHAFATSDGEKPPFIAFADTLLYLPEIYGLKTDAQLVVLSACQTLEGKDYRGEGIMSLTRAFRFIGVPGIVASLWQADENSTSQLMVDFYKRMEDGLEKDEALRQAKLTYIESGENAFPFFWANMVQRGNSRAISLEPKRNYFLLILLGGIMFLAVAGLIFRKKR